MNVLHISTAKNWRGGERQTYYLIQGQYELGDSVHLMSPQESILSERSLKYCKGQIGYSSGVFFLMRNIRNLSKYCSNNNIDIIHGHDSHSHTLIWLTYKYASLNVKSVVTRRLANDVKHKSIEKYNYPKIEAIICISKAVYNTLLPSIKNEKRLALINSGVELPNKKRAIRELSDNFTIGYVAAFTEEKDHVTFVDAAKKLLMDNRELNFLLVGDGKLKNQIQSLVSEFNSNFEFTGFIEDVNSVYQRIDLLMHTSSEEALGTSIIDALKYSIPVVASDVSGIKEILEDKKNGLFAETNNPISFYNMVSKILREEELYKSLSKNAFASIKKFNKSIMIRKTQELYTKILFSNLEDY